MVFKAELALVRRTIVNSRINDELKKMRFMSCLVSIRNDQDKAVHL
jgi:hypothetical protein